MLIVYRKTDGKIMHNTGTSNVHPEGPSDTNGKLAVIEREGGEFDDYGLYRLHDIEDEKKVNDILNAYAYELIFDESNNSIEVELIEKPFDKVQVNKINELSSKCRDVIINGFVASNGNGYRLTVEDQLNMQGQKSELDDDSAIEEVDWMTIDDVNVTHTRDGWLTVYKEGFQHKNDSIFKNKRLRDEVRACTTKEEVEAVTW
ncbi:hypothetical protein D7Z54_14605 [Salibacterium salarium]|uniref:DUF4376 domain-containing protein n=1 Tax=Salibacterium salarium TaxID=284579 RepID=A0A428N2Z4_9BACI|nr:hypothetical protein [Salibacterium salarium]RSL32677.1 hypothetical protein D7Z54_14605 [Salibacterium salarium]